MNYRLGIIIPVYNSTRSVLELLDNMKYSLASIRYHVWLVDDSGDCGHSDWLSTHCVTPQSTLIVLRQNSGQQNAILCGIRAAAEECDAIATMDDDLQHPAELLPRMYHKLMQGNDIVYALADGEKKPFLRRIGSLCRDILFRLLMQAPRGVRVSSFRVMDASLAREAAMHDYKFFYLTASTLPAAKNVANVSYPAIMRPYGKSGYRFSRLCGIYFGILRTYTSWGRTLFHPEKGMAYEVEKVFEGDYTG